MAGKIRYGVMGAGLIGSYLGGLLAAAGRDVTFVGRGQVRGGIAKAGLRLTDYKGAEHRPQDFLYVTDATVLSHCNVVLVTVKTQASAEVARELSPILKSDTLVISFQNGLGNDCVLREHLSGQDVLPGMVPFNVTSPGPGHFHQGTEGNLYVRAVSDHRLIDMKTAFESVGMDVDLRDPLIGVQWGKLLLNLNNSLNTLHGDTLRTGLIQKSYRRVLARLIEEGLAALAAAGIRPESPTKLSPDKLPAILRLPTPAYKLLMDKLLKIDPTARSSMLEDLELGRTSENAFIQGEIIDLGRRVGASVETNRRVAEAVEHAFAAGKSPRLSGDEMVRRFLA